MDLLEKLKSMNMYSTFLMFQRAEYTMDDGYAHLLEHYLILRIRKELGVKIFGETSGIYMLFWWVSRKNKIDKIINFIDIEITRIWNTDREILAKAIVEVSDEIQSRSVDIQKYIDMCLKVNGFFSGSPLGLESVDLERIQDVDFSKAIYLDKKNIYIFDASGNPIRCQEENIFEDLKDKTSTLNNIIFTSEFTENNIRLIYKNKNIFTKKEEIYFLANHLSKIMLSNIIRRLMLTSLDFTKDRGQGRIILYNNLFLYESFEMNGKTKFENAKKNFIKASKNKDKIFSEGVEIYREIKEWFLNNVNKFEYNLIKAEDLRKEIIYNCVYGESYLCRDYNILTKSLDILSEENFLAYIGLFFEESS